MSDLISRQVAIDALEEQLDYLQMLNKDENPGAESKWYGVNWARNTIADLPSAQLDRDIPMKPNETTDRSWGIPKKQAVCPKCDYYLGHVSFLGDYKGKRITYCETCGQAIDWEGWNWDE